MDSSEDKQWASKYLLDPLTGSQPHQETGPGTRFASMVKSNKGPSVTTLPTPPTSASPNRSSFHPSNPYSPTYRKQAFSAYADDGPSQPQGNIKPKSEANNSGRRRGTSLGERFPGDMSHRPLDLLKKEAQQADRAPHLKKKHLPGADLIDSLDRTVIGGAYHHGGPYDATLLSRNTISQSSPVEAVRETNAEALKATPKELIRDALDKHVPLQGTAVIPPGEYDLSGTEMRYEEGADLMREEDAPGGAYKRWVGIKYLPEDFKGKGEPAFTIEKALKEHQGQASAHRRVMSDGDSAYEMQTRPGPTLQRSASGNRADLVGMPGVNSGSAMGRSNTTGRRVGEGLKKRFGSLRRTKKMTDDL